MLQQSELGQKVDLPLDQVFEWENVRRTYEPKKLAELTESIRARGVEVPIIVRPVEGGWQVVAGYRRRRASLAAGLSTIPALVRELTDEQALELQLIENLQRADPHPLDEADGFRRLQKLGHTVQVIAAKVAKEESYVTKRLQLCALGKRAREAFLAGKVTDYAATQLATIPDAKLQAQAVEEMCRWKDPLGPAAVRELMDRHYRLRLKGAPFPISDANLLKGTPSCNTCSKRTGNQPELFDDASSKDLCTDAPCFKAKSEAAWTRKCEAALARGQEILEEETSSRLFSWGDRLAYGAPYVDLSEECPGAPGGKTWGSILGPYKPPTLLARDSRGRAHQLVRREDAEPLRRTALNLLPQDKDQEERKAQAKQEREKAKHRRAVVTRGLARVAEEAARQGPTEVLLRFIAREAYRSAWHDLQREVAVRRGFQAKGYEGTQQMAEHLSTLNGSELLGFIVELHASRFAYSKHQVGFGDAFRAACELLGLDLDVLDNEVRAQVAPRVRSAKPSQEVVAAAESEQDEAGGERLVA